MSNVLSCFFPTTVVLVDDDFAFLRLLQMSLENAPFVCKTFSDAAEALDFINTSSRDNKLDCSSLIRNGEEGTSEYKSILLDIGGLHTEIYSPMRFSKVSVVVSDYRMPSMNGVEFCSKITDKNIQKVLLTGLAEDRVGIDAFNAGYISCFSHKNLSIDLLDIVNRSARKFFSIYTDCMLQYTSFGELRHLKDPVFADFFYRVFAQGNFVEYYMLDSCGSYLLVTADGKMRVLGVLTEAELTRLIGVAIASGEADEETLNKLQSREYILAYYGRRGSLPPVSDWKSFLQPAGKLEGVQTYYYIISEEEVADIDKDEIVSFNTFMASGEG